MFHLAFVSFVYIPEYINMFVCISPTLDMLDGTLLGSDTVTVHMELDHAFCEVASEAFFTYHNLTEQLHCCPHSGDASVET